MPATEDERRQAGIEAVERQVLSLGRGSVTLPAEALDGLRSALAVHVDLLRAVRRADSAVRTLARRSSDRVAAHLATHLCPLILMRFAALLPIADDPDGALRTPNEALATEYAEAIAAIFAWEAAVGPDSRLRSAIQTKLSGVTRTCQVRIESHLQVHSDADIPDVRLLARDILRIEAVEWAVVVAGGPAQAVELRQLAHRAARKSIQWAGVVFGRFKAGPDEFSHFDAVATLSAVDDLLVVILRVVESDRDDREAGSHPFVLTLGEQALQDFSDGLEHMTNRYLTIAEQYLLHAGADGSFLRSVLLVLERILRLGHALLPWVNLMEFRLNHEATVVRVAAMRAKLRASLAMPGASADYQVRLRILESALAEIGA